MTLAELNALPEDQARSALTRCCGASRWVDAMLGRRPYAGKSAVLAAAETAWAAAGEADRLEAFAHHPRIGGRDALRARFAATRDWSRGEQSGAAAADEVTLAALAEGNAAYEKKFGMIFIVCATGKSAAEVLALLKARLAHDRAAEFVVAAGEQAKITRLRLEKLLT